MFCEKCGRKNDDHANHCEGCGAALQGPVAPGAGAGAGVPSGKGAMSPAAAAAPGQGRTAQGPEGLGHLVPLVAVALVMFLPRTLFGLVIQGGRVFEVKAIDKFVDAHIKGINQTFLFLNVLELVSFILIFAILFSIVSNKRS